MLRYHPDGLTVRELKEILKDAPDLDPAGQENRVKVVTEQGTRNIVQSCANQSIVLLELGITRDRVDRRTRTVIPENYPNERRVKK